MSATARKPIVRTTPGACRYSDLEPGDQLCGGLTITETHVVLAAGLFNDPGPNHVNALQADSGRFGTRIAHGPLLVGVMAGTLGNVLGSTIVALLEQSSAFRHPTRLGDPVLCRWTVRSRTAKPAFGGGGIVRFAGEAFNQDQVLLADMTMTLAVADAPLWDPVAHLPPPTDQQKGPTT
jgi:3-hydroxybutyryl-CoA dehydratase